MIRLSQSTGTVENKKNPSDNQNQIVRPAILVHAGDNGSEVTFVSGDGEISFSDERIQAIVDAHNEKIMNLAEGYGGLDKMPVGAYPPILDQHEADSSNRVIGRLASLLRFERRDVPGVGKNIACACADITFIGVDTVEKVNDGRIYHLSIGIDENSNTLGETSAVITPAAPGAMLLKKGTVTKKGEKMSEIKKRLESHKTKLSKLSSLSDTLTTLGKKLDSANSTLKLTKKEGEITTKLTGLMKSGKLTPAEFKGINIKKLSALPQEAVDVLMETYEALQPKIDPVQKGSTDAIDFSRLGKEMEKSQLSRLKAETKKDLIKLGAKIKMSEEEEKEEGKKLSFPTEEKPMEEQPKVGLAKHLEMLSKHLEEGKIEEAKKLCSDMKNMSGETEDVKEMAAGDVKSEDYKASMEALQAQIDELNTQMARIGGAVKEIMDVEKAEGEGLAEEAKKHEELPALEKDQEPTAQLEGDKKEEEEKKLAEDEEKKKEEEKKLSEAETKAKEELKKDLTNGGKAPQTV